MSSLDSFFESISFIRLLLDFSFSLSSASCTCWSLSASVAIVGR